MSIHRSVQNKGSALIGIVIAIVVFSVLAAALVPMISSSSHQAALGQMSTKAYLMAESGFRFAAAKYLHALPDKGNDTLENLEGNYTLSDGTSRFHLSVYSYFGEIENDDLPKDAQTFQLHFPGSLPDDISLNPNQDLLIGEKFDPAHIYTISTVSGSADDRRAITLTAAIANNGYPAGTQVYPVAHADNLQTPSVSHGGNLAYQSGNGEMFPLRNGRIRVRDRFLNYRFNDRGNSRFVDVRDPDDDAMSGFTIDEDEPIVLAPFVRVDATGFYGGGAMTARRRVTYYAPLPLNESAMEKRAFTERFDSKDDWRDVQGTTQIAPVNGDSALNVTATGPSGASLTVFNPTTNAAAAMNFNTARRGTRGYLSYDAQIKVGLQDDTGPKKAFAAGLSFRLSQADSGLFGGSKGYGITFVRPYGEGGGIPEGIIPGDMADEAIVLWRKTSENNDPVWLAFKNTLIRSDLSLDGARWHERSPGAWNAEIFTGSTELDAPRIALIFFSPYYGIFVSIKIGDDDWTPVPSDNASGLYTVDLSKYTGSQLSAVRFTFPVGITPDTESPIVNIRIENQWPTRNATIGVRLHEAMVVRFSDGYPRITSGSRIYGQDRRTTARVLAAPLVSEGDWSESHPAKGVLLLQRPFVLTTDAAFNSGEVLTVIGGSGRATVESYDPYKDLKANIIQVFYASESGGGDTFGNTNPLDAHTRPYPRLSPTDELRWPPELGNGGEWVLDGADFTVQEDYFRLIQWDGINDGSIGDLDGIPFSTIDQGLVFDVVIQNHHADLQTPDYPEIHSEAEIGLHAFGAGAGNVYFDDFGLQMAVSQDYTIPSPLQE